MPTKQELSGGPPTESPRRARGLFTALLDDRHGPLRESFEAALPDLSAVQKAWRELGKPMIMPPATVTTGMLSVIGTPMDYRIRYRFGVTDPADFTDATGARAMRPPWPSGRSVTSELLMVCTMRRLSSASDFLSGRYRCGVHQCGFVVRRWVRVI